VVKHVQQEDPRGCGLACVAMISGKSYEEVKDNWISHGGDVRIVASGGRGLTTKEIQDLLKELDVKSWNCLMGTPGIVNVKDHFIVIGENGKILNPAVEKSV